MKQTIALFLAVLTIITVSAFSVAANADRPDTARPPVSQKKEKTTTDTKKEKAVKPFDYTTQNNVALYRAQPGDFIVSAIYKDEDYYNTFFTTVQKLRDNTEVRKFAWDHDKASLSNEGSFMLVQRDGSRVFFSLNKKNRIQAGEDYYQIPADVYTELKAIYDAPPRSAKFAQWLIYMTPSRITKVKLHQNGTTKEVTATNLEEAIQTVRAIRVQKGTSNYPLQYDIADTKGVTEIELVFELKAKTKKEKAQTVSYHIYIREDNTMVIQTSDLRFECEYTLVDGEGSTILKKIEGYTQK